MISRKKRSRVLTAFLAATLSSVGLLAALPTTAAAQVGFAFGINDRGAFGLTNTSASAVTLNSFTVTFTAPNQTFFDTAPTNPGTLSTGFNVFLNTNGGITSITLPSDAATDGQQTATFSFTGFDPGDVAGISFDLDTFGISEGPGTPAGGLVSALFSNGQTASGIIGAAPINTPQFGNFDRGVFVVSPDPVPEPGEYATAAAFLGTMGILMIRGRRIRARLVA